MLRRRHYIYRIRQGSAQPLHVNFRASFQRHLTPAFETQRVGEADNLVLELQPMLLPRRPAHGSSKGMVRGRPTRKAKRFGVIEHRIDRRYQDITFMMIGIGRSPSVRFAATTLLQRGLPPWEVVISGWCSIQQSVGEVVAIREDLFELLQRSISIRLLTGI